MSSSALHPEVHFENGESGNVSSGHLLRSRAGRSQQRRGLALAARASSAASSVAGSQSPMAQMDSGSVSGLVTPLPDNALPSTKALSSSRQQVRAEQRRRLFPTIEFASRVSHFDPESDYRDFHGFFNLFWIGLAIMAITTMLRNIKDTGYPLRIQIWSLFTIKVQELAILDFCMVASTAASLPLHKLFRSAPAYGILTWSKGGMAIQSIYQVGWLALWVWLPFQRQWTWTAQVFFLLHTMVLLMKMHSYAFYNGHLSETEKRLRALDQPGATDHRPAYLYPSRDRPDGELANPKRRSLLVSKGASPYTTDDEDVVGTLREDLARELVSPMGNIVYPKNLTWANYSDYLLCPTLCYELEYPRVPNINWISLVSKFIAVFGCIFLLTIISEEFIYPVLLEAQTRLEAGARQSAGEMLLVIAESISWMLFPFMLTFLLVFLVIFEYVLGTFAEITRFGDRHFYSDWWNSTDWMEFSREWNVPVYSFLRRHVYSTSRPHIGRPMATVITFLISAIGHEVIMACITKKLRGYGFVCQMLQLPLVMIQKTKWVRGKTTMNNVFFWCSMVLGLSMVSWLGLSSREGFSRYVFDLLIVYMFQICTLYVLV